jgi:hypothetical protein
MNNQNDIIKKLLAPVSTLEASWEKYKAAFLDGRPVPTWEIEQRREVFFLGATAMFDLVANPNTIRELVDTKGEDKFYDHVNDVMNEVKKFAEDTLAKRASEAMDQFNGTSLGPMMDMGDDVKVQFLNADGVPPEVLNKVAAAFGALADEAAIKAAAKKH